MEHWWKNSAGYIEGRVSTPSGWRRIRQHRWIMEQHLGRQLEPGEIVHHKNGVRDDNRLANLEIMCRGEHAKHHLPENGAFLAARPLGTAAMVRKNKEQGPWNKGTATVWDVSCEVCGAQFQRLAHEVRKSIRRGWRVVCSRRCASQPK